MNSEPDDLGARLLDVEPISVAHRQRLEQEIHNMFEQKLSRGWRVYWTISLVAAAGFAALGAAVLFRGDADGFIRGVWWVYILANLGFVLLAGHILRSGKLNVRRFQNWAKLSPALTLAIVVLLFIRAVGRPTTEAVLWVLFGVVCLLLALSITVYNRIVTAEMSQREQVLRLELRLMELLERVQKA
jgi:hypothetical protein